MSDDLITTIIGALQAVTIALVGLAGLWLRGVARDAGEAKRQAAGARINAHAARVQVENNHDTNLREESDERHAEIRDRIDSLTGTLRVVVRDIGGLREEARDDRRATRSRFDALERRLNKENL